MMMRDRPPMSRNRARLTRVTRSSRNDRASGASVEFIAVAYDFEEAARRAERNGRKEWAHALRTGFMPG